MVPPITAKKRNGDGNSADSSIVWHIFKKTSNPKAAYCLKCKKEYRTGGGTSNLRKHFFTKHKDIFDLISGSARSRTANTSKENIEDDSEERSEEVLSDTDEEEFVLGRKRSRPIIEDCDDEEDSNTIGAHSTREASLEKALPEDSNVTKMMSQSKSMMVPEKKQLTIPEAHLRKESYSKGGAKQMKLTMWLLKGQSMGLVKENFFMMESSKDWLKQMFPLYETVPEEMIEETQELMFKTFHIFAKEKLKNAKTYSLTVDVKERAAMDTYVELTAVIPADAENSLVYLPLSHLKVAQCSEVQLITFIKKTLSSFGLMDKTMVFLLFSGRKSIFENLDKSTEKTFQSVAKFQCLKDILSEILSDALNDSTLINELFERVSEIIQFIQTSDELLDAARRAGSTHEKDKKTMEYLLRLPFADSTDLSLYTTFAAISGSLSKLITDSQLYECPNLLSLADNKTLKESVDVLQPLQAFSSQLRSPKMPLLISEYIPLLVTIRTCITKVDVLCEGALELKKNILGKLSRAIDNMLAKKNVVKAMMLDCRFKQRLLTALQYSNNRQEIMEEARAAEQLQPHQQFQDVNGDAANTSEPLSLIDAFGSPAFWTLHSSLLGTGVMENLAGSARPNNLSDSPTKLKISNFFQKSPNPNIIGLDYWRAMLKESERSVEEDKSVIFCKLGLKYISIPAHSSAISAHLNCSQKGFQLKAISSLPDSVW